MKYGMGSSDSCGMSRIVLLFMVITGLSGCLQPANMEVYLTEPPYFNDRIRLDRQGLSPGQATRPAGYGRYRNGQSGNRNTEVISPLFPILGDGKAEKLVRSNCYWTARRQGQPGGTRGDPVQLSWEMVVAVQRGPTKLACDSPASFGACRLRHPVNGKPIISHINEPCEDEPPPAVMSYRLHLAEMMGYNFAASGDRMVFALDEDKEAFLSHVEMTQATANGDRTCPGTAGQFQPFEGHAVPLQFLGGAHGCGLSGSSNGPTHSACGVRCNFIPQSGGTIMLSGPNKAATYPVAPNLQVVDGQAVLRRVMLTDGGDHRWATGVASQGGLVRWHENFSPGAVVESVRVFQRLPDGTETGLPPGSSDSLVIEGIYPDGSGSTITEVWSCRGMAETGGGPGLHVPLLDVPGVECDGPGTGDALAVTPSYAVSHLDAAAGPLEDPLDWRLELDGALERDAEVVLEFHLDVQTRGAALQITPSFTDFGEVERGKRRQAEAQLTNIGWQTMRIDKLQLHGTQKSEFAFRLPIEPKPVPLPIRIKTTEYGIEFSTPEGAAEMPILRRLADVAGPPHVRMTPPRTIDGTTINYLGHDLTWDGWRLTYENVDADFTFPDEAEGFSYPFSILAYHGFIERAVPFSLLPGESVDIHLSAVPAGYLEREASLWIDAVPPANPANTMQLRLPLSIEGLVGASLEVFPPIPLELPMGHPDNLSYRRNVLLINSGDLPADRIGLSVDGPDAANFSLISANASTETIEPGESERYSIEYMPTCLPLPNMPPGKPWQRNAQLVIQTSAGDFTAPLVGRWDESCP